MAIYRVPVQLNFAGNGGGPGVNVWHIRTTVDGGGASSTQTLINSIRTFYADLAAAGTPSIYASAFTITLGAVVDVQTDEQVVPTWDPITTGTAAANAPQALQVCISWRTTIAARRGRGRTFVGPLAGASLDVNGAILPTARTRILTAAQGIVTRNGTLGDGAVAVWGKQVAGGPDGPDAPRVARDITGATVGTKFAVLRSRRD